MKIAIMLLALHAPQNYTPLPVQQVRCWTLCVPQTCSLRPYSCPPPVCVLTCD